MPNPPVELRDGTNHGVDIDGEISPSLHPTARRGNGRVDLNQMAVLTGDMTSFIDYVTYDVFGPNLDPEKKCQALEVTQAKFGAYVEIFQRMFPDRSFIISEDDSDRILTEMVTKVLTDKPNRVVIFNDRYLGRRLRLEEKHPYNFFRISTTRNLTGGNTGTQESDIIPRPGDPLIDDQLDAIERKLNAVARSLKGVEVILGDDVTVTNSTENGLARKLEVRGVKVNKQESVYVYQAWMGKPDQTRTRPNIGAHLRKRVASTEQRELATDGPLIRIGKDIALQNPGQSPWGNGGITRTNGRIDRSAIDSHLLKLYKHLIDDVEDILRGEQRRDGTTFNGFTLGDFRYKIPFSLDFMPSRLFQLSYEKTGQVPMSLHDLRLLDLIDMAMEAIKGEQKPDITHVVTDLDGTVLKMKYDNSTKRNFYESRLGTAVRDEFNRLLDEFKANSQETDIEIETINIKRPNSVLNASRMFVEFLEKEYGEETYNHLLTRFNSFYGTDRGLIELTKFIQETPYLPHAYHVLREFTWGRIDFDEIYEPDTGKAKEFALETIKLGGALIFLSAGPKIHSMRILEVTGLADLVRNGQAELVTVEDLYDPETLEEQSKLVAFAALSVANEGIAREIFDNAQKSGIIIDIEQALRTYRKLKFKFNPIKAAHPNLVLSIGDQPWSDIRTIVSNGGEAQLPDKGTGKPQLPQNGSGFLVAGPELLNQVFNFANIRNFASIVEEQGKDVSITPNVQLRQGIIFDDTERYKQVYLAS